MIAKATLDTLIAEWAIAVLRLEPPTLAMWLGDVTHSTGALPRPLHARPVPAAELATLRGSTTAFAFRPNKGFDEIPAFTGEMHEKDKDWLAQGPIPGHSRGAHRTGD